MTLREQLLEMAEPSYLDFILPLMPGVKNVLGIPFPACGASPATRHGATGAHFWPKTPSPAISRRLLRGLVIGCPRGLCARGESDRTAEFLPMIDNWAVCDCFCAGGCALDGARAHVAVHPALFPVGTRYEVRFAAVMALGNFIDEEHLETLLGQLDGVRHEGYYARMAVAWAFRCAS